ncbi:MAG: ribose 5-phosphate isomerase A, partial [Ignavibacteriales bacterium]|nr:ribose 5-phosphate isomerase A [Ignavibacteriales bacterium]
ELQAKEFNIPLTNFLEHPIIDITIDGADEVDPELNLIKGGGGALLKEKIIAQASKKEIIMVDGSKLVNKLGEKWHVPIEVIPFAVGTEINYLKSIGANKVDIRKTKSNELFLTDENNVILDANFGVIENPTELARKLGQRAGIVEHGLFIGMTSEVIVASSDGIKILTNK